MLLRCCVPEGVSESETQTETHLWTRDIRLDQRESISVIRSDDCKPLLSVD